MNNENIETSTVHVTAPSILNKPSQTMPQRSPFAIQELLGLGDSHQHRSPTAAVSAITPNVYNPQRHHLQATTCFPSDHHGFNHHHMTMAASRMAYFNAQAAVAAAFLPHNIAAAAGMNANGTASPAAAVLGLAGHQTGGAGFSIGKFGMSCRGRGKKSTHI
ncbi:unnamed protein product [Phyllotreta striolata]|uniref:Uncharacterized protein n=1 Tax=Phyllotreta striolata TaxID=444603 RepID=A0A9N9TYF5_PHYSR|nr:unnamed protein product [Phyllotreta striolata]